jgi:hypothetical protein
MAACISTCSAAAARDERPKFENASPSFSGEHGIGRANQADYSRYTPSQIKRFSAEVIKVFSTLPSAAIDFGP